MAKASGKIKIQICITMSLWDAIKLRIAGKAARDLVEDSGAVMTCEADYLYINREE